MTMTMTTHRQTISSPHLGSMFVSLSCISDPPLSCPCALSRPCPHHIHVPRRLCSGRIRVLIASIPLAAFQVLIAFRALVAFYALTDLAHWSVDDIPPSSSPIRFQAGLLQVYDLSVQQHSISCVTKATFVRHQPFLCSTRGDTQFRRHFPNDGH